MDNVQDRITPGRLNRSTSPMRPASARVFLSSDLWFDPDASMLLHSGERIRLTAREAAVLAALLQAPRCWHSAADLAQRLKRRWPHTTAHTVEQTIYGLRHKLGESGRRPGILLNRYDEGYRIFPQEDTDAAP